jgi:hypothetical protein
MSLEMKSPDSAAMKSSDGVATESPDNRYPGGYFPVFGAF